MRKIREKSGNFIIFTFPKEKVIVTSVCCFFHNQKTYSLNSNDWLWRLFGVKSLLFYLSLGSFGEFDLYPHHGILKIHQGKIRENRGIRFDEMLRTLFSGLLPTSAEPTLTYCWLNVEPARRL